MLQEGSSVVSMVSRRAPKDCVAHTSFCVYRRDFQIRNGYKRPNRDKNQEVNLGRGRSQGVGIVPVGDFVRRELWPRDQEVMGGHSPYPAVPSTTSDRTICNMRRGRRMLWRAIVRDVVLLLLEDRRVLCWACICRRRGGARAEGFHG